MVGRMTPEQRMRSRFALQSAAPDAVGAKLDFAVKNHLPSDLVLATDNRELTMLELDPYKYDSGTVNYFAGRPYAAAVFRDAEARERIDRLFRDAGIEPELSPEDWERVRREELERSIAAAIPDDAATAATATEHVGAQRGLFQKMTAMVDSLSPFDALQSPADRERGRRKDQAAIQLDKARRAYHLAQYALASDPYFFTGSEESKALLLPLHMEAFTRDTGIRVDDLDPAEFFNRDSSIDWANAANVFGAVDAVRRGLKLADIGPQVDNPAAYTNLASRGLLRNSNAASPESWYSGTVAEEYAWRDAFAAMRGKTLAATVADGVLGSVPFMVELALTAPVAGAGRAGVAGLFGRIFGTGAAAQTAGKGAGIVAGELLRLPAFTPKVVLDALRDIEQPTLQQDESGELYWDFTPEQQITFADALVKHYTLRFSENLVEGAGGLLTDSKAVRAVRQALTDKLLAGAGKLGLANLRVPVAPGLAKKLRGVADKVNAFRKGGQMQGFFPELLEEVATPAVQKVFDNLGNALDIAGWKAIEQERYLPDEEELQAIFWSTLILTGVLGAPNRVANIAGRMNTGRGVRNLQGQYALLPEVKSEEEAAALIRDVHRQNGGETKLRVDALEAQTFFQERPELLTALDLTADETSRVEAATAANETVEFDAAKLMARFRKAGVSEADFNEFTKLALDQPGGYHVLAPEVDAEEMAETTGKAVSAETMERVRQETVYAKELNKEYEARFAEFGDALTDAGYSNNRRKASLALFDRIVRTFAADLGKTPLEVLGDLRVRSAVAGDAGKDADTFFQPLPEDAERFSRDLDRLTSSGKAPARGVLAVTSHTPAVLQRLGMPDAPITISPEVIAKAAGLVPASGEPHQVSKRQLKQLPDSLFNPVAVFDSATRPGSLVVLTRIFDKAGKPVIAAIHISPGNNDILQINRIASAYGKKNIGVFQEWTKAGLLRYIHKERAADWAASSGVQFPGVGLPLQQLNHIIVDEGPDVKEQSVQTVKKGAFSAADNAVYLFEAADVSTFSHEVIHWARELLGEMDAQGLLAGTPLAADLEALRNYEMADGVRDAERTPKAFERYLMTGQAPAELKKIFAQFREWLTAVYRTVRGYFDGVQVTPEVKDVFDRWLFSEAQADRQFIDNELFSAITRYRYGGATGGERRTGLPTAEALRASTVEELNKEHAKNLRLVETEARKKARAEVAALPVYRASREIILQGKFEPGVIEAEYGPEVLAQLRQRRLIGRRVSAEVREAATRLDRKELNWKDVPEKMRRDVLGLILEAGVYAEPNPQAQLEYLAEYGEARGIPAELVGVGLKVYNQEKARIEAEAAALLDGTKVPSTEVPDATFLVGPEAEGELPGVLPAEIAAEFEFDSAAALIQELTEQPSAADYVRNAIDDARRRYAEQYPASEAADRAAAVIDAVDAIIDDLSQNTDSAATRLRRAELKDAVAKELGGMTVKEALRTDIKTGAIRKLSTAFLKSHNKGDHAGMLAAATSLRIQLEMLGQMRALREEVGKTSRRAKKQVRANKGSARAKVAGDLQYHYIRLANDFGLSAVGTKRLEKPPELDELLARCGCDLSEKILPPKVNFRALTVDQFHSLSELMEGVYLLGRELVSNSEASRFARQERQTEKLMAQLDTLPDAAQLRSGASPWEQVQYGTARTVGFFRNLLGVCRFLDNYVNADGKGVGGVFEQGIYNKLHLAAGTQAALTEDVMNAANPNIQALRAKGATLPRSMVGLPELPEATRQFSAKAWTFEMRMMVALNCGNETNRRRLQEGYGWSDADIESIISCFDTPADWAAIQGIWDALDQLYQPLDKAYYAVNYQHLYREPATPFQVKLADGNTLDVRGGYLPLSYDGRIPTGRAAVTTLEMNGDAGRAPMAPTAGATKDRVDHLDRLVDLSVAGLAKHVEESAHYAAFKVAAAEIAPLFDNPTFLQAAKAKLGGRYKAFHDMVANAINPVRPERSGLKMLRGAAVAGGLWFNLGSGIKQLTTFAAGIEAVGWSNYLSVGLPRFWSNPHAGIVEVNDLSSFMRDRYRGKDRDIRTELTDIARSGFDRARQKAKQAGYYHIKVLDAVAAYPVWMTAYQQALDAGYTQADAVMLADKLTVDTQGAGRPLDASGAQISSATNIFMMFSGPSVALFNRNMSLLSGLVKGTVSPTVFASGLFNNFLIQSVLMFAISDLLSNSLADLWDDDERKRTRAQKRLLAEFGNTALMGVPFLRNASETVLGVSNRSFMEAPLGFLFTNVGGAAASTIKGDYGKATLQASEALGGYLGVPVPTVLRRLNRIKEAYSK